MSKLLGDAMRFLRNSLSKKLTHAQGLFVLYDDDFKWTRDLQPTREIAGKDFKKQTENFLAFTAGRPS